MPAKLRNKLLHRLQLPESWVIFFIMGVIMMNFPFLQIFNKADTIMGLPLMYLYLVIGWAVSIFIIYIFTHAVAPSDDKRRENRQP